MPVEFVCVWFAFWASACSGWIHCHEVILWPVPWTGIVLGRLMPVPSPRLEAHLSFGALLS